MVSGMPALREQLEEVLRSRKNFEGFAIELDFAGVGRRKVLLDGRRFESGRPGGDVVVLVVRDVTEHAS
jgi:hypothetical protein